MNTNSKHYETLNIQPWEIMERNFTTEEFVAYLKGNIIKYTLRDKGQALTDAEKIKHYAEKLIEVLEKKETDEFLEEDAEHIYGEKDCLEEAVYEPKFKVGDRVRVLKGNITGTIIREPEKELKRTCKDCYIVELDGNYDGWKATKERHLVDSENAWYVDENDLELLNEKPTPVLTPNVWHDASLYKVETLSKLLPKDTLVQVTALEDNDRKVNLRGEKVKEARVIAVGQRQHTKDTRIEVTGEIFVRRYFKIIKED